VTLVNEIEKVIKDIGFWPTKTTFIREACLEKLEKYRRRTDQ
jgi:endonuclease III